MLDTNTLSYLVRSPGGTVASKIAEALSNGGSICISLVVAAEVRFGVLKKGSRILARQVEAILESIPIVPLEVGVGHEYARIRAELEREGRLIGANDLLIAAHAVATDHILVSHNVREFERVPRLKVEDWISEVK